jgi:hypothetical protein
MRGRMLGVVVKVKMKVKVKQVMGSTGMHLTMHGSQMRRWALGVGPPRSLPPQRPHLRPHT